MTTSSQHYLVITALGADRPGIVNTITRHVSSCGCNIEDSRLAMLGEEFTFIMLLSGTWNAITLIESTLPLKGAELDLLIVMKRTTARPRPAMPATVWVQVEVPDSPHLIERFTALFDSHQMNIAELVSRTQPGDASTVPTLFIQITAHSPASQDASNIEQKFSLPDQDGEQVNLTDFQGQRVLVYFYPKAMTPGCTVQACGLRDNMDELKKVGVEVLGISTDKPEKLSRFAEKELLNFTLLSDEDHQVCEQFGVWGEKTFMGKTYDGIHRISFLIDADGKVEHVFDDFKTSNHHDVVLNWLKESA
ncbi:MAG: glycine cleavage system transcriptional repressor [Enterobacter roggenkampii]|nr:glycine cleavage system transcriptional repressor [Enterobacter roggenkampii]